MRFRIGRYRDLEMIAGLGPDEFDQFVGIAQLAGTAHARRQIAAQRHQTVHAILAIGLEQLAKRAFLATDARQMRCRADTAATHRLDGIEGPGLSGTAGTVGHGEEARIPRGQCIAYPAELFPSCFGIGRKEFETDAQRRLRAHDMTLFDASQRDDTPAEGVVLGP